MKNISIGLICFTTIILGLAPNIANAEISYPYKVDEKSQVIFGDSVHIEIFDGQATTTYYGLENYKQEYVGSYAHFTFTYTHTVDNYASYPPMIYVTVTDPRLSANPFTKATDYAFVLRDKWYIPGSHPTDWYFYDIQFDATGYNIIVKQGGHTEIVNEHRNVPDQLDTDWVALANWFPTYGNPGPNSMAFTPVPIKEGPQKLDPVIIIPGIMGSDYSPILNKLVIDPVLHTYDNLIETFEANGYVENKNLFTFPYEWRDSNVLTANLLKDKISQVKQICIASNLPDINCNKVDLVAHSMGGLVAREYIQSGQYQNDVDQLIFLGTPHKGAPKAYLTWEAGEFEKDIFSSILKIKFNTEAIKNLYPNLFSYIHERPISSIQELLPVFDYLKDEHTGIVRQYSNNYPRNIFLEALNSNISNLLNSGVKITNIVGSAENNTIEKIRVTESSDSEKWIHGEPVSFYSNNTNNGFEYGSGDTTVTTYGSTLDDSILNKVEDATHLQLPTAAEGDIVKILTSKDSVENIDRSIIRNMLVIQLHSPIDVVVTDPDGNRVGKNFETGQIYNEISLAFYSGYQTDNEFITIPDPLNGEYKVEVQGTGNGGEYGVLTSYASDDFGTTTEVQGTTQPNQVTQLKVQVDNENPGELQTARVITSEVLLNDIKKSYELGWITDRKLYEKLLRSAQGIIRIEKKPVRTTKKTWWAQETVDRKAAKALVLELRGYQRNKINEQAYNIIKQDLEYLINNN